MGHGSSGRVPAQSNEFKLQYQNKTNNKKSTKTQNEHESKSGKDILKIRSHLDVLEALRSPALGSPTPKSTMAGTPTEAPLHRGTLTELPFLNPMVVP
jgi:hypothetical protein